MLKIQNGAQIQDGRHNVFIDFDKILWIALIQFTKWPKNSTWLFIIS
jgi:hypothetical protein